MQIQGAKSKQPSKGSLEIIRVLIKASSLKNTLKQPQQVFLYINDYLEENARKNFLSN